MGWNEVNAGPGGDPEKAEQEKKRRAQSELAVRQAAREALDGAGQKPLREALRKIALASSYAPGRDHADMAFAEGKRAMAVWLLQMGGNDE